MIIQIEKQKEDLYRVNLKDLPGSPPIGEGKTPEEAVVRLFFVVLYEKIWTGYINLTKYEIEWVEKNSF